MARKIKTTDLKFLIRKFNEFTKKIDTKTTTDIMFCGMAMNDTGGEYMRCKSKCKKCPLLKLIGKEKP